MEQHDLTLDSLCHHSVKRTNDDGDGDDNDDETIQRDRKQFDHMLRTLDPLLCVVSVQRRVGCDLFILHSHSLAHHKAIVEWIADNVSTVRYSVIRTSYTGYERTQVDGQWYTLRASRPTLMIEREAYRTVCPGLCTTLVSTMRWTIHLSLLIFCLLFLYHLVTL